MMHNDDVFDSVLFCSNLTDNLSLGDKNKKQWDSDLVEAKYIKDLEENLSIIRLKFGDCSKPLFRNREFIVYERRETMDDGTLVRRKKT